MFKSSPTLRALGTCPSQPGTTWRQELARAFSNVSDLLTALELDPDMVGVQDDVLKTFPLRVPRGYVSRMRKRDIEDPLLRQVLPIADEARIVSGYKLDPVGDLNSARGPGILQKYRGRVLLIVTGACGIHCRYCFRRAYPYHEASVNSGQIEAVMRMLNSDRSVEEVILSGGDPLSLSNERLEILLQALGRVSHLKRIRIHTRLPVVLPERIDSGLVAALSRVVKPLIFVLHFNHANEIDTPTAEAITALSNHTFMLLNQAVLLRGVNDTVTDLVALSERLFDIGVSPYYLHQLDPVQGAAHFQVGDYRARKLIGAAAALLPGYLVPRLVRENPGGSAKELMAPVQTSD